MGDWSLLEGQLVDTVGQNLAASRGVTVTGAAANVKGAWLQIVASTTYAADGIYVTATQEGLFAYLVDVAIGAADSEQIIAADLLVSRGKLQTTDFLIPVPIPAGSRIAVRCQSTGVNQLIYVTVGLLSQGFMPSAPLAKVTTYGANTADSGGTQVDPGAVAHTKGAYSQIDAATANPIRALLIAPGNQDNIARVTCVWLMDIAIGALGLEQIILPNLALGCFNADDNMNPPTLGPFFIDIPAGTRLAARAQSSTTDAEDRLFDVILYGID